MFCWFYSLVQYCVILAMFSHLSALPLWPPYLFVLFIRFLKVSVGLFVVQVAGV